MISQETQDRAAAFRRSRGLPESYAGWTHDDHMRFGVDQGWWRDFDQIGPLKTLTFAVSDCPTWEDVAVKAGLFPSKGQARKAGWDGPACGKRFAKSKRLIVEVA